MNESESWKGEMKSAYELHGCASSIHGHQYVKERLCSVTRVWRDELEIFFEVDDISCEYDVSCLYY